MKSTQSNIELLANRLLGDIENLVRANYFTGIWDNRRFQLCKKPYSRFSDTDKNYLYKTEKKSRSNVERRAIERSNIEKNFIKIVKHIRNARRWDIIV